MQRTVAIVLLAMITLSWSAGVRADDGAPRPADILLEAFELGALPAAPDDFTQRIDGPVRWDFPRAVGGLVDELMAVQRREWPRIERELGRDVDDQVVIRVARDPDEMRNLAPSGAPPPAYAVGVAYPQSGLVLLTLSAPETWQRPDLPSVLTHELSHIALHRAVEGHPVPRWFTEGLAIHQAREGSIERMQTLWEATFGGTLIPLQELTQSFPDGTRRANLAYAQSADFVEWLRRRGGGDSKFVELIGRLSRGRSFEGAIDETWTASLGQLEDEWRDRLNERYGALPLLVGTGGLWGLIALLAIVAWWRQKRTARLTLARWDREEAEEANAIARAAAMQSSPSPPQPPIQIMHVAPTQPQPPEVAIVIPKGDEPRVPTIVVDGRSHTLH